MRVSIGVHRFGAAPIDPEAVLRGADAAMYKVKPGARPRPQDATRPVLSPPGLRFRRRPVRQA